MRRRDLWYSAMTEHVGPPCSRLIDGIALVVNSDLSSGIPTSIRSPGHCESSWTMECARLGSVVAEQPFSGILFIELPLVAVTSADVGEGEDGVNAAE